MQPVRTATKGSTWQSTRTESRKQPHHTGAGRVRASSAGLGRAGACESPRTRRGRAARVAGAWVRPLHMVASVVGSRPAGHNISTCSAPGAEAERRRRAARKKPATTAAVVAAGRPLGQGDATSSAAAVPREYVAVQRVRSEPAPVRSDVRLEQNAAYEEVARLLMLVARCASRSASQSLRADRERELEAARLEQERREQEEFERVLLASKVSCEGLLAPPFSLAAKARGTGSGAASARDQTTGTGADRARWGAVWWVGGGCSRRTQWTASSSSSAARLAWCSGASAPPIRWTGLWLRSWRRATSLPAWAGPCPRVSWPCSPHTTFIRCTVAPSQKLLAVTKDAATVFSAAGDCGTLLGRNTSLVVQLQDDDDDDEVVPHCGLLMVMLNVAAGTTVIWHLTCASYPKLSSAP